MIVTVIMTVIFFFGLKKVAITDKAELQNSKKITLSKGEMQ